MKFKYEITEGQFMPPWYYGYAYREWHRATMVFYVIPINFVIRAYMFIEYKWNRFRGMPSYVDLMINKTVHEREKHRVKELDDMTRRLRLIEDKLIANGLMINE